MRLILTLFVSLLIYSFKSNVEARDWCKVIYNKEITAGELVEQTEKCRNSDNVFLAIHSSYKNAGHLLNSFIAEFCDLDRQVVKSEPRQGDPYFSLVCEFRRHILRK